MSTAKAYLVRRSSGGCGISGGASGGGGNSGCRSGGVGGGGEGAEERLNSTAYNNYYVDGQWGLFRHAGAMGIITRKERLAGVDIPVLLIEPTYKACPAFHIKGMCNTGCGNAADHVPHTQEQDLSLWGWAVQAMPDIAAPAAPIV